MSLLKWIVGGALVAAVCFFFPSLGRYVAFLALAALILTVGIVVAYRVRNPHAREMRHERSHAREHEGETRDTETGASEGLAEKARRLFPEDASIPRLSAGAALVFVAFCIYWFGIDDAISQYGFVGMGGWDILHWRAIALFWGMLGGGVWLLAGKRSAKFQSGLSIAMVALFVVAPILGWIGGAWDEHRAERATESLASQQCAGGGQVVLAPNEEQAGHIHVPVGCHIVASGTLPFLLHEVHADNSSCIPARGGCPTAADVDHDFFQNLSDRPNPVSYTFAEH